MVRSGCGITPLDGKQVAVEEGQARREKYPLRLLVGLDQFVNLACGGRPDETISSRAARAAVAGRWWGRVMSKCLDRFAVDHGADAQAGDLERAEQLAALELESGTLGR